ncbi:DNA/RNA non-specific endonuclease [Methylibium rhizosphaerae]|uniref:DNA/RNA non-specific endonuclease n=1 Tax=Methylibium rhizosphaerae TaxID=2570323 RepID=UPI0015E348AC|nr:DNA/RNA non-specific endonuclease [Methylibium rhizosphaerae]
MKLTSDLLDSAEVTFGSITDILNLKADNAKRTAVELDGSAHANRRKAMIARTTIDAVENANERYFEGDDLLPINYLALGLAKARSVGMVSYFDRRDRRIYKATGFLVSPDLLLTNHHVFPAADLADFQGKFEDCVVQFGFEFGLDGKPQEPVVFDLDPQAFFYTFEGLDLAVVAVKALDRSGSIKLSAQGYLVLNGEVGKAGESEFASVIQHAEGKEKQVALRDNEILKYRASDTMLFYKSDTELGSSGSPVFNDDWQVIALHSAGVAKKNAAGQYLDEDDNIIPVVNGTVDGTRIVWECNRGFRVSSLVKHLRDDAPAAVRQSRFIQPLFGPGYSDARDLAFLSLPRPELAVVVPAEKVSDVAAFAAPVAAPERRVINIHIAVDGAGAVSAARVPARVELEFEKKYEDEMDFSACDGYQQDFMSGVRIPMPVPNDDLREMLAFRIDRPSSYLLKYHHYSTIHHAVRRVPVVSAINVTGKRRYPELSGRNDKWFRDNRIDYDVQLDDAWYRYSGFDKGHLSRREDAEWGESMGKALLAADMTCAYTNAVPQVPGLNRAKYGYHGLWGKLEDKLLEQGVALEPGKANRICLFAGPIFDSQDRPFKGVQVALSFYKVVVWFDATGALRTTCFVLDQKRLVGDIEFEALHFDEVFHSKQKSLQLIEEKTGLKFAAVMHDCDTFDGDETTDGEEVLERIVADPPGASRRSGSLPPEPLSTPSSFRHPND